MTGIWAKVLFRRFLELCEAANRGNLVTFEGLHDEVTKNYKELDIADQGAFHDLISEHMKE